MDNGTLRFGYAEADITPIDGEDLCGFALRAGAVTGVHDRLKVRWLSLSGGNDAPVLIGSADIISLTRAYDSSVKKSIASKIPAANLSANLATTHTHSGPATVPLKHCGVMSRAYMSSLKDRLVDTAVRAASLKGSQVVLSVGRSESDWGFNRRHRGKSVPVDNEVLALVARNAKTGKPEAVLANYACHPVVLGHESNAVSADYPGYLSAYVQSQVGAPCLYLNGACGDVNPRNEHMADPVEAKKAGEAIGAKVVQAVESARQITAYPAAKVYSTTVRLPVHRPESGAEIRSRLDELQKQFGMAHDLFRGRVERDLRRLKQGRYPAAVAIDLTLVALGSDVAILFVPGELFSSLGLALKSLANPANLIISGFSNGSVGYLPDVAAYKDGGYEPHYANFFYDFPEFEPSVGETVLAGGARLIKQWKNL